MAMAGPCSVPGEGSASRCWPASSAPWPRPSARPPRAPPPTSPGRRTEPCDGGVAGPRDPAPRPLFLRPSPYFRPPLSTPRASDSPTEQKRTKAAHPLELLSSNSERKLFLSRRKKQQLRYPADPSPTHLPSQPRPPSAPILTSPTPPIQCFSACLKRTNGMTEGHTRDGGNGERDAAATPPPFAPSTRRRGLAVQPPHLVNFHFEFLSFHLRDV